MKPHDTILEAGRFYHIYNRGINGANLFYEERNYGYFLQKYAYYMCDVVDTYAYCLLKNHFHLLVRVKENLLMPDPSGLQDLTGLKKGLHTPEHLVSKKFSDLFNAYTKSINKAYNRTGGLFETPFKRLLVNDDTYLNRLVCYIHSNPEKHGFVEDFKDYPHSSYHSLLVQKPTKLAREAAIELFDNRDGYLQYHTLKQTESGFNHLIIEFD
jgi:hypothetical protein